MKRWILMISAGVSVVTCIVLYSAFGYLDFKNGWQVVLFIFLVLSVAFLVFATYVTFNFQSKIRVKALENRLSVWTKLSYHVNQVGDEIFNELPIGMLAIDEKYDIKWANPFSYEIFDNKIVNKNLKDVNQQLFQNASSSKANFTINVKGETYDVVYRQKYQFFYLFNATEREDIKAKYAKSIPALGIIYLDNLEESLASLDVSEQSRLNGEYLSTVADWVSEYDGYLKPYGDERLVMITSKSELDKMIADKFQVVDKIRYISNENDVKVSLSMGIACWDTNYEELGVYAQNAIELAEKRGGDQVVVNIQDQKILYFGAKTDNSTKSSKVGTRIAAQTISDFSSKSDMVIIMAHALSDMDAFGALIAMYHLAKQSNHNIKMVLDEDNLDYTVKRVLSIVKENEPDLISNFVKSEKALELMTHETLLIVVDTQSPNLVMSKEVLDKASKLIIVDHHRVSDEGFDAEFSYIEPSASSSVELVVELLSFIDSDKLNISELEATVMYGGLVVDTKDFSSRTGVRTFEVASKLRELGADTAEVKVWLRRDLSRTLTINKLLSTVDVYLDRFAFVVTNEVIADDRTLLAQISEAALQIDGIDAAFTIARISDDVVGVSARSYQGVNVQLVMETLGGGGHINSAAVQIKDGDPKAIKKSIEKYLELEYGKGGEKVKIILLEDVKGKGKKDDIVEVTNGFGQFLVNQKKAIMATEENVAKVTKEKEELLDAERRHLEVMKKLKDEIDNKVVTIGIQIGQDGKLFGSVTTKQIVEGFESEYGILLDKKKVELSSEINSLGIYTAYVTLHREVKAQFEVHVVEK